MAEGYKSFDTWLPGSIGKPSEAAYFLFSALEDSIEQKDLAHFVKALRIVSKEHHLDMERAISMTFENIRAEDAPTFRENIGILIANMVSSSKEFQAMHA